MLLVNDRVEVDGYKGTIKGRNPNTGYYEVQFDVGHPFAIDTWELPESRFKKLSAIKPFPTFGEWTREYHAQTPTRPKCECGAHKLGKRDQSPYSHATWCIMFKQGEIDD